MADINKIIRVLDLSQSAAREETLNGIVKFILYSKQDTGIDQKNISDEIVKELTISIHDHEIDLCINFLLDKGVIELSENKKLKLSNEEELKFRQESLKINENRNARFEVFKKNIEKISLKRSYAIVETEINELWEIFRTFIYDCYLTHGKNAIDSLIKGESEDDSDVKRIVKKYLKEAKSKELSDILSDYIMIYPEVIDTNILEYLTGLANKTESFYALGLSQEEYNQIYSDLKFDWIVFVDTNFIYSILNLHNHPENQASKYLLELGTELGISFKFTTKTFEELNQRKKDFERYLEKDLVPSQIRALLKSDKLDSFAQSYYEKLLEDRDNTPHPSEIITHSLNSLKSKNLVLYNSKFNAVTQNEDYLLDQESQYNTYLEILDDAKEAFGQKRKGPKDPAQVQHDVFLREVILHLRSKDVSSLSNAKYFGVTLDKTLVKFDLYELNKKKVGIIIPTFFKPSILLNKLIRQAPLKTKENYLRAFISTISTPAIEENNYTSRVAIRSLKFFHKMGIDNEKLILDCLKDELFLKSFEKNESSEKGLEEFVESEINKQITIKTEKINELESAYVTKESQLDKATELTTITKKENEKLKQKANSIKESLLLYERELKKLKKNTSKFVKQNNTVQLTIDDESERIEADNRLYYNKLLKSKLIDERLKKRKQTGYFYLVIALFLVFSIILIYAYKEKSWNFMTSLINQINGLDETRKSLTYIFLPIILGIIDVFLIAKIINIFFSKKSKKEFIKDVEEELTI